MSIHLRSWKKYGHRYLLRLLTTCVCLFLVPCFISLYTVMFRSYHEMLNTSESYYLELTQNFSDYFVHQLDKMHEQALLIGIDSRDSRKAGYALQQQLLQKNAYYIKEAASAMSGYNQLNTYQIFLYYPELDVMLSSSNHFSARSLLQYRLRQPSEEIQTAFSDFLNQTDTEMCLFSTFGSNGTCALYAAFRIKIGMEKNDAVVLYEISAGTMNDGALAAVKTDGAQLLVENTDQQLLYLSAGSSPLSDDLSLTAEEEDQVQTIYVGKNRYALFCHTDVFGFCYRLMLPHDQLTSGLFRFYNTLRLITTLCCILMLLAAAAMLFINYTPVFRTVSKYGLEHVQDEFSALEQSFEQISNENLDKDSTILELLCRNMLYGVPIPPNQAALLGAHANAPYFCVVTVSALKFDTGERQLLAELLADQLKIRAYITDLLPETRSVIVCFMPQPDRDALRACIASWVQKNFPVPAEIYAGAVVSSINEIHDSFCSCTEQQQQDALENPDESNSGTSEQTMNSLTQDILSYIDTNYSDCTLGRTAVADAFHISVYSLSRLFKSQMNIGFSEYLISCRLQHVTQLLRTTENSISEISDACGFTSSSYLSKLFKATYGTTPLQYRKNALDTAVKTQ